MAVEQDDAVRLKIVDSDGDSIFTHGREPNGSVVIACFDRDREEYAACTLQADEVERLIARLTER